MLLLAYTKRSCRASRLVITARSQINKVCKAVCQRTLAATLGSKLPNMIFTLTHSSYTHQLDKLFLLVRHQVVSRTDKELPSVLLCLTTAASRASDQSSQHDKGMLQPLLMMHEHGHELLREQEKIRLTHLDLVIGVLQNDCSQVDHGCHACTTCQKPCTKNVDGQMGAPSEFMLPHVPGSPVGALTSPDQACTRFCRRSHGMLLKIQAASASQEGTVSCSQPVFS